ncbi:putative olfactory receptor 52P1 [Dromiciops gliroides]|uniref:putative olfactory receptor 52P1 n=1 Tax=Dromiciops gliroides TaxID=33562 RepID=UPI001CC6AECD|nr:putative olfactory receptor 52P1 [Dromiciops gliroides]
MVGNVTLPGFSSFFLAGIPGLEVFHYWLSIPVCLLYALTLIGNGLIVFVIRGESSLHQPMFFFLCMLAFDDVAVASTIAPRMLDIFWLDSHFIGFDVCLAQMCLIHTFCCIQSGLLVAMAFDRYVAICYPLHYATILTTPLVIKLGLLSVARAIIMVFPSPLLVKRLRYCTQNIIRHTYCEHMAVVKLACSNTSINRVYGILVSFSVIFLDIGLISVSYVKILQAVFRLSSKDARSKALGTCAAHIFTILVTYVPALFSFLTHRIGKRVPPSLHIIIASIYPLVPPAVNPLVYGVKTKQIRGQVVLLFLRKKDKVSKN